MYLDIISTVFPPLDFSQVVLTGTICKYCATLGKPLEYNWCLCLIPCGIVIVAQGSSSMIIDILVLCVNSLLPVGPKILIAYGSNVKIIIQKCFLCPLYSPKNGLMGWCEQLGLVGLSILLVVTFKALVTVNCFWVNYIHYFTFIIIQCWISNIVVETLHILNINLICCFKTCKIISSYTWSGFLYFDYTLIPRPNKWCISKSNNKVDRSVKQAWLSECCYLILNIADQSWNLSLNSEFANNIPQLKNIYLQSNIYDPTIVAERSNPKTFHIQQHGIHDHQKKDLVLVAQ